MLPYRQTQTSRDITGAIEEIAGRAGDAAELDRDERVNGPSRQLYVSMIFEGLRRTLNPQFIRAQTHQPRIELFNKGGDFNDAVDGSYADEMRVFDRAGQLALSVRAVFKPGQGAIFQYREGLGRETDFQPIEIDKMPVSIGRGQVRLIEAVDKAFLGWVIDKIKPAFGITGDFSLKARY